MDYFNLLTDIELSQINEVDDEVGDNEYKLSDEEILENLKIELAEIELRGDYDEF